MVKPIYASVTMFVPDFNNKPYEIDLNGLPPELRRNYIKGPIRNKEIEDIISRSNYNLFDEESD
jgi:hypothetical protein